MSNGESLREAIRANPTDPTVRLVFADWLEENDQPGGDLIRVLINSPFGEAAPQIVEWFHSHYGWPFPERLIASEWLRDVLIAERWGDWERLRGCIKAIAQRMLPIAKHHLTIQRTFLDAHLVVHAVDSRGFIDMPQGGRVALAAANLAEGYLSGPTDESGDASNREYREQIHIVAWAWFGLPPLRKAPELGGVIPEPPSAPEPPRRPWWQRIFGGGGRF